jgi:hypothetical protein
MFRFRRGSALVALVLMSACASASPKSGLEPASPSPSPALASTPTPVASLDNSVLVGQIDQPPTVVVIRRGGSTIATLAGTGVPDQHAVGAYVVVDGGGSGKAWSVDAKGTIKPVAQAAVKLLESNPYSPPLIIDSSTAIIACARTVQGCSVQRVDLGTGAVQTLFTAAAVTGQAAMEYGASLVALDVSTDASKVWLRKIGPAAGSGSWRLDLVGVDIRTGSVTSHNLPDALMGDPDLATSRGGELVAGQEGAGTNSANLAIAHLHIFSLDTNSDADVQGAAPYVRGWPPPGAPTVVFAPDGGAVAWWGGFNNGDTDYRVNLATAVSAGRQLLRLSDTTYGQHLTAVYWLDTTTLVAQADAATLSIETTSGAIKELPPSINALVAVLR